MAKQPQQRSAILQGTLDMLILRTLSYGSAHGHQIGMASDRNREFKYYRLTDKGKKQLVVEESQWKQMSEAVARVMWSAAEES